MDSGASGSCISKSLWDKIKISNKLAKSQMVLTGAGGSKLSLLGFTDIKCSIGRFVFIEEFAVIDGMVSDMLLGINGNIGTTFTLVGRGMEITTYQEANTILLLKVRTD